jgi:hypothetical protein
VAQRQDYCKDYQKCISQTLRPIISAVNTYNYKLAKYLDEILKPFSQTSEHMLKDTFDFVNKVNRINTETDKYMVSFDIESLFTNIPTQEMIEIILSIVFEKSESFHGLKTRSKTALNNMHSRVALSVQREIVRPSRLYLDGIAARISFCKHLYEPLREEIYERT